MKCHPPKKGKIYHQVGGRSFYTPLPKRNAKNNHKNMFYILIFNSPLIWMLKGSYHLQELFYQNVPCSSGHEEGQGIGSLGCLSIVRPPFLVVQNI